MTGVELLVGGWFASPVIKSLLDKVEKYLATNRELQKGYQDVDEFFTFKNNLLLCQAAITEAEKRRIISNPALAGFLKVFKNTLYDAEDVLDNMEAKPIKEKVQGKNKVRKLASSSVSAAWNIFFPDDNLKSLKKIHDQLNQLRNNISETLKLIKMNNELHTSAVTDPRETISKPLDGVGLHGRKDELNLILDIILHSKSEDSESSNKKGQNHKNNLGPLVIPIVGMGGVGKTALALVIYNHPEVQRIFTSKAWIPVSYNFNAESLMSNIYQDFGGNLSLHKVTLDHISKKFDHMMGKQKFLIVLDDMFGKNENEWDKLYAMLSKDHPDSVVIITTQNQAFANRVATFSTITLSVLGPDTFWELFECIVFRNLSILPERKIHLESIGREIVKKLHGLPLAAKIIGKILRSKVKEDDWRMILKSEWWDIPNVENQIFPSIGLGYEQLDPCIRQCFAYCSLFPRNSLIEKDRLVHMWMAQNFIQPYPNSEITLEDIGRRWFDELVERSFFQHVGDNSYVMHELMHDLAVIVSSGECFYLSERVYEIPLGVRHLAVDTNNPEVIKGIIKKHKNLRSFLYFGCCQVKGMYSAINDVLSNLHSIRVLDLSYFDMGRGSEPPPAIWNLKHLRFLDLSSTNIKYFTHSSIGLYHLQALYIKKCKFKKLRGIDKLINLRHLYADDKAIAQISGIGQLTSLQELSVFFVGEKKGHRITELGNLIRIRGTLRIENFKNVENKEEAKLANLGFMECLDTICYSSNSYTECSSGELEFLSQNLKEKDMEVLEELKPHKNIENIRIDGYFGRHFPNWIEIGNFLNLNTLYLISCVNVEFLPTLGELPRLKFLHIKELSSVKLISFGGRKTVFPRLEELVLETLSNCEKWTANEEERDFFPCLSKLTIKNNKKLREAPLHLFSSSLVELTIHGCPCLILHGIFIPRLPSLIRLELYGSKVDIPFDPLNMQLLEDLNLNDCSELRIEGNLHSLTHLKRLTLVKCPNLFSKYSTRDQQKGKGLYLQGKGLRSLTHIKLDPSLLQHEYYHEILGSLPSLQVLIFSEITMFTNHQKLWFGELTALQEIHFSNCTLKHLRASLTLLSSVKKMALISCTELESLPDKMPPNLQELTLSGCSQNFVQQCQAYMDQGRLPIIRINDVIDMKTTSGVDTQERGTGTEAEDDSDGACDSQEGNLRYMNNDY